LDAAQAALDSARSAGAESYAADAYNRAKNTLADAGAKSEQGEYEEAKTAAVQAKEQADQAKSLAESTKARVRDEAQAIVSRVSNAIGDARSAVDGAPRGKGADGDLDQLRADLGQAEAALGSARSSLSSGNFNAALDQAKSSESKLNQVQSAVQVAVQKIDNFKMKHRPWYEL
jgi:multidrug efflux pump subunit AcrA (membrane-fusion protein)